MGGNYSSWFSWPLSASEVDATLLAAPDDNDDNERRKCRTTTMVEKETEQDRIPIEYNEHLFLVLSMMLRRSFQLVQLRDGVIDVVGMDGVILYGGSKGIQSKSVQAGTKGYIYLTKEKVLYIHFCDDEGTHDLYLGNHGIEGRVLA